LYYFRYKVLKWLFSGAGPVTLDTLSLLEDAAERDADGEEEDGGGDAGGRVVVLDAAAAVGAVVPFQILIFILVLFPAFVAPSVHHIVGVSCLVLFRALAHCRDLHAEQTFATTLPNTFFGFGLLFGCRHDPLLLALGCWRWRPFLAHREMTQ